MPVLEINKTNIDAIKRPAKKEPILYFHTDGTGFGVRVTHGTDPDEPGSRPHIAYILQRKQKGKAVRVKIGTYPGMAPKDAQKRARALAVEMDGGVNPNEEKRRESAQGVTLKQVFDEYLNDKELRPKTRVIYLSVFKNHLSDLHDKPLTEIDTTIIRHKYKSIRDNKGKATASQAIRLVSALFNHAIICELAEVKGNPVIPLRQITPGWSLTPRRQTVLLKDDLKPFYKALGELQNETTQDYLMLLVFAGLRRSEAASLKWTDYDSRHKLLTLPAEHNKSGRDCVLPVSKFVAKLLERRFKSNEDSEFIFPSSTSKSGHIEECKTATKVISSKIGKSFSAHDARRGFATAATQLGINTITLKQLMNHSTESEVTSGYVIADAEALREPSEKISKHFEKCMGIK